MNKRKQKLTKLTAFCMTFCMAAAASEALTFSAAAAPGSTAYAAGDCNKDGKIDGTDVFLLRDWLLNQGESNQYGDLDGDKILTAKDLTLLKRKVMTPEAAEEKAVMLVYLCGSDLESGQDDRGQMYAEATEDLSEMMEATYTDDLEVVLLTGGSKNWKTPYASADGNYYITINADGVSSEKMSGGQHYMSDSSTLQTFIEEATAAHPATHYGLVLWDHGSGPLYGLCYDELADDMLYLSELNSAIKNAGVHFDWIGFDCCLMGSAEVAYTLRDYADYMIGSEESESGLGWTYTDFLTKWAKKPDMDVPTLAKYIIDDMVATNKMYRCEATLACYDLHYADALMQSIYGYTAELYQTYKSSGISNIVAARSKCMDFGDGEFDLVDVGSLMTNLPNNSSDAVLAAVDNMVIYHKNYILDDACGVSTWFFENYPGDAEYLSYMYSSLDFDSDYLKQMAAMARAASGSSTAKAFSPRTFDEIVAALHKLNRYN